MRQFALTTVKSGISRLRTKGSADKDTLYEGRNCYVTASKSIRPRPGARKVYTLPINTKGLMAFKGKLHVFSHEPQVSSDPNVIVDVLRHPDPDKADRPIKYIWFAKPFLDFPYVVAEFEQEDDVFIHFWLQETGVWQANHVYSEGEVIRPTTENGYTYQANRLTPAGPLWKANEPRAIGDRVEPTVPNGYQFTVIDTVGTNPASGATEPDWNTAPGALTYEDVTGQTGDSGGTGGNGGTTTPPPGVVDRYKNGLNDPLFRTQAP